MRLACYCLKVTGRCPMWSRRRQSVDGRQIRFGDEIELVGAQAPQGRFVAGDIIDVTLYWRTQSPIAQDYPLFVQLLAPDHTVLGNITTHPGWGRFPTSLWQADRIYVDRYRLRVDVEIEERSPLAATVAVGFFDPQTEQPLPVHGAEGEDTKFAAVATVDLLPREIVQIDDLNLQSADVQFGDVIRLTGYRLPDQADATTTTDEGALTVTLAWEATAAPDSNFTAFVHLIDGAGEQVAGFDQPPAQGRFPTSHWLPGDRIISEFPIPLADVSPGIYEVWTGLYADLAGEVRLPVDSANLPAADQRILLGTVTIY
ncbi:MAG: hypothetical protein R2873_33980 [Caldilineaceae bacterium]